MECTEEYIKIKKNNCWFVTRNNFIYGLIKKHTIRDDIKILDAGCAQGNLLLYLRNKGFKNICGIDSNKELLKQLSDSDIETHTMDLIKTDFDDETFDVIVSSDIIEHIDDDMKAIHEMKRILKKDGIIIIFVPAFMSLWSYHDVINGHKRRYTLKELESKILGSGLTIQKASYWNFFMFFPNFLVRKTKSMIGFKKSDFYSFPELINLIIIYIIHFENFLLKYIDLPFGVSAFVVAKKI
ncbi:MAG: class I SAM-dependent methyltransferase [Elusimicrobiales bacterium]|nr:class I SAM-dependent methyltransferase [Elusimicrobiales bacterium]